MIALGRVSQTCGRVALELEERPMARYKLLNIEAELEGVAADLQHELATCAADYGPTREVRMAEAAVTGLQDHLDWALHSHLDAPIPDYRAELQDAQYCALDALRLLLRQERRTIRTA